MTAPVATYRLQFRGGMNFDRAAALVPYLGRLGITHLYASPVFTAVSGSSHGYDITDCNNVEPALGGREGLERLSHTLHAAGLGLVLDIVPNHMAASPENGWWRSVVEWGAQSVRARYFDIDWNEKLTLPVLDRDFADCAQAGGIVLGLDRDQGCAVLCHGAGRFPLHPASYEEIFARFDSPLAAALARRAASASPQDEAGFHDEIRRVLAAGDADGLEAEMKRRSRKPGFLAWVHDEQAFRLMPWKEARRHLSYRRFFEVTGLVGMRVEDEAVFAATHRLVAELVAGGVADALRVDHVDGLADPGAYLRRLRAEIGPDIPVIVEKILEPGENLPRSWPVAGTTGYEFITSLAGLFTDPDGLGTLDAAWSALAADHADPARERRAAKAGILEKNFEGELSRLAALARKPLGRAGAEPDDAAIRAALAAIVVAFPIYRTYGDGQGMTKHDAALLDRVTEKAVAGEPAACARWVPVIAAMLKGQGPAGQGAGAVEFRCRFQQLTGPVMAKAVEDTLFYRYNRLIALNEVGGDPVIPPDGPESFHRAMKERAAGHACGLSATATHDTKRGEDARARLYALSEYAKEWSGAVARWRAMNADGRRDLPDGPAPEPETEWLIYQALAGVWPEELEPDDTKGLLLLEKRFLPYLEKALREAKRRTNWIAVNAPYEKSVLAYAAMLLAPGKLSFREDFVASLRPVIDAGHCLSLAQTLLKMAAPGIPDIYQGAEGRDLSLVDPDNRRMPDYAGLQSALHGDCGGLARPYVCKQHLVARCLGERSRRPALFSAGAYVALEVRGRHAGALAAFMRRDGEERALALASCRVRFLLDAEGRYRPQAWGDTAVILPAPSPAAAWRNVVDGRTLELRASMPVAALLAELPVALIVNDDQPRGRGGKTARFRRQPWSNDPAPPGAESRQQREKAMDERRKQIERRAYELWEEEGRPAGRELAHWDQAAREFDETDAGKATQAYLSEQEGAAFIATPDAPARKRRAPAKPRAKKT